MKISEFSCISSVVLSSIIISAICIIRKRYRFTRVSDVKTFMVLYMIGFLRLFLPLDFEFTKGVDIEGHYSSFWNVIFVEEYTIFSIHFTIIQILIGLIIIISLIRFIKLTISYIRDKHIIECFEEYDVIQLERVYSRLGNYDFVIPKCRVVKGSVIAMPSVSGIFQKKIVLPDIEYSDAELFYILFHELTHIRRNDLYAKLAIELFRSIFWWIPFSSYVSKDIEQTMEINCDLSVTGKLTDIEKISYMQTLINSMKQSADIKQNLSSSLSFALQENKKAMLERFELMRSDGTNKRGIRAKILLSVGVLMLVVSYLFVPLPYYRPNDMELVKDGVILSAENTYLVYENGKYYAFYGAVSKEIPEEHIDFFLEKGIQIKEE